jgi:hypothetical protein
MSELMGTSAPEWDSFLKAEKHHNSKEDGETNWGGGGGEEDFNKYIHVKCT